MSHVRGGGLYSEVQCMGPPEQNDGQTPGKNSLCPGMSANKCEIYAATFGDIFANLTHI